MGRYEKCEYFDTLYTAVEDCFSPIGKNDARTLLRETILAPDDYEVEFNDTSYGKTEIMMMIAEQLRQNCVDDTPKETFTRIIDTAADIIKRTNDGYITQEDYEERCNFLETTARTEFMLFSALALIQTASPGDDVVSATLPMNIIRLREVRDLILNYSQDGVDITIGRDEYEKAKPIYKMLKSLQTLGYDYNFSPKERASMNIYHDNDEDLTAEFNYSNWLKRIMLLKLRQEMSSFQPVELAEAVNLPIRETAKDDIGTRIAQLRGTYDKRRFDRNRFIMLEEKNKPQNADGDNLD